MPKLNSLQQMILDLTTFSKYVSLYIREVTWPTFSPSGMGIDQSLYDHRKQILEFINKNNKQFTKEEIEKIYLVVQSEDSTAMSLNLICQAIGYNKKSLLNVKKKAVLEFSLNAVARLPSMNKFQEIPNYDQDASFNLVAFKVLLDEVVCSVTEAYMLLVSDDEKYMYSFSMFGVQLSQLRCSLKDLIEMDLKLPKKFSEFLLCIDNFLNEKNEMETVI